MNLETIAQLVPQILALKHDLGAAMTPPQQLFVSQFYTQLGPYLQTDAGRGALQAFVNTWMAHPAYAPAPTLEDQPRP
jgi:hypothetical protein